nr:MAG TPA_asm: hypothetical protein [Caudoviricetes sp.]
MRQRGETAARRGGYTSAGRLERQQSTFIGGT